MVRLPTQDVILGVETDCMSTEALFERLQALKATIAITEDIKEKKCLNGEIRYLEYLIMEEDTNYGY